MTAPAKPRPLSFDEAIALLMQRTPVLGPETVDLSAARGRVLRAEVRADRDQPPFDRSAMDGFAVRSAEVKAGLTFPVLTTVPAGAAAGAFETTMPPGSVAAIGTGAPVPAGADAVIPIEQAEVDRSPKPAQVRFTVASVQPRQNIHTRASDAARGQVLLTAGTLLGPHHIGIAAAVGATRLSVSRLPRVTVLTTGDELRPPATPTADLQPAQIRNSNGAMLLALLAAVGVPALSHQHAVDDPEITLAAAREALSHSNLVVTVGGVSAGERDYLPPAWRHLGLEFLIHGINIQPGRPVLVARPAEVDDPRLVLGLPGNPVSVLCCAHLFLAPILRRMQGVAGIEGQPLAWRPVRLAAAVKASAKRLVFRAARLGPDGTATVVNWHGSGDLAHTATGDGFVRLPQQDEPVPEGSTVPFLPLVGS